MSLGNAAVLLFSSWRSCRGGPGRGRLLARVFLGGAAVVTEAEARAALRASVVVGEIERWIADQRWEAVPGGWRVREQLHSWRFRAEPVAGGVRVVMSARGGGPAVWTIPDRPAHEAT
jgi:hypothetical protein